MVGLEIPVQPLRRELLITEPLTADFDDVPKDMPFTIDYSTSLYWHREGNAMLMGFSDKTVEYSWDLRRDPNFLEKIGELADVRAPRLLELGAASGWAGLYDVAPDHNAIMGEWEGVSRFLYATGFSGHGFLQGPAIGEILRDMYLGKTPFVDITPLSNDRFSSGGELRPEKNII
jgi:sarcosine oxidase subunit beta